MAKQLDQLKQHFDSGASLTVAEALSQFGIYALSQRCGQLIASGYPLDSETVKLPNGKRISRYFKAKGQLSLLGKEAA